MAANTNKFPAWFITFICVFICVPVASAKCTDGIYKHDGRDCCLCGAGSYLTEHCITSQNYGKCKPCGTGTYNSHPNNRLSCDPCTSCSHPNDNLEEDEPCTPARDTKCRCKEDHYCAIDIEICKLCHPCTKCGEEGIKVRCTGRNDTVCNIKTEGGLSVGLIVGIIFAILVVTALVGGGVFIWKKKEKKRSMILQRENANPNDVEIQLIEDVDLEPHLNDIALVVGWKDMKGVAMRSKIPTTVIDACELNHPGDAEEQTIELLRKWVERQGKAASKNLVEILLKSGKKGKAEKVNGILAARSNVDPV